MKKNCITFLFLIVALSSFSQEVRSPFNGQEGQIFYHTVEQGQTVYGISIMYQVTEDDIYRLNPSSREYIKIGERLVIPQKEIFNPSVEDDVYIFHTIQPGETIYGVSGKYNITPEQLTNANLGLSPQTFASGKTIRIPVAKMQALPITEKQIVTKEIDYTIKRRETMFSLTRTFGVSSEQLLKLNPILKNGLKAGMVIKIPVETEDIVTITPGQAGSDINTLIADRNRSVKVDVIKIALLLPFADIRLSPSRAEFYEGFLMAMEELRNYGISIDLSLHDIGEGTQKTREILQREQFLNYNLLIGGETNEQIELIANHALRNQIKYVVPFSSNCERLTSNNAFMFQVNTPTQLLYSYITEWACSLFTNYNILFVNTNDTKEDKSPFVRAFKANLTQRSIPFRDINYNVNTFRNDISGSLSSTKPNLIVPFSSSLEALNKIRGTLRILAEANTTRQITLFGYPEWQQYTNECLEDFYALNTHIYTSFFANNLSTDIQQFHANYNRWYNKNMISSYPKYALLGYDTGMFFISAVHTFGTNFENNILKVNYKGLQKGFRFERVNNWSGFLNTNMYMVNYKKDFTITRLEKL
jgi:Predicted glycosyl hydrolase